MRGLLELKKRLSLDCWLQTIITHQTVQTLPVFWYSQNGFRKMVGLKKTVSNPGNTNNEKAKIHFKKNIKSEKLNHMLPANTCTFSSSKRDSVT